MATAQQGPVKLVLMRPLYTTDYFGRTDMFGPGQQVTVPAEDAEKFEENGWAYRHFEPRPLPDFRKYVAPVQTYETKVITPAVEKTPAELAHTLKNKRK